MVVKFSPEFEGETKSYVEVLQSGACCLLIVVFMCIAPEAEGCFHDTGKKKKEFVACVPQNIQNKRKTQHMLLRNFLRGRFMTRSNNHLFAQYRRSLPSLFVPELQHGWVPVFSRPFSTVEEISQWERRKRRHGKMNWGCRGRKKWRKKGQKIERERNLTRDVTGSMGLWTVSWTLLEAPGALERGKLPTVFRKRGLDQCTVWYKDGTGAKWIL